VSELDELIKQPGIYMAARFGPDGRITDHKTSGLFVDNPVAIEMGQSFCAAITMMFKSMAHAMDTVSINQIYNESTWLPFQSWTYSGGMYVIAVTGDRFVLGERSKFASLDELSRLLRAE
jgi:roadblock/LC7 domain-containing protein